jgi:hypothetical protein
MNHYSQQIQVQPFITPVKNEVNKEVYTFPSFEKLNLNFEGNKKSKKERYSSKSPYLKSNRSFKKLNEGKKQRKKTRLLTWKKKIEERGTKLCVKQSP